MNSLLHNLVERSLQPTQGLRIVPPLYRGEASAAITPTSFTQSEVAFSREFPSTIGTSEQLVGIGPPEAPPSTTDTMENPASSMSRNVRPMIRSEEGSNDTALPEATSSTSDLLENPAPLMSRNVRSVIRSDEASASDPVLPPSDVVISPDSLRSLKSSIRSGDRSSPPHSTAGSKDEGESLAIRGQQRRGSSEVDVPNGNQDENKRSGIDRPALTFFDETVRLEKPQQIEEPGDKSYRNQLVQDQRLQNQNTVRRAAGYEAAERTLRPITSVAAGPNIEAVAASGRHVMISIGRLELKVTGGKPIPERSVAQVPATSSLDEYLRQRAAGGAR